ncbi:MAG: divalent-cation tolerance protein CutA [Acidobacteria bacterium]|nr:divalent-cation tolerance protein CutA [Acidobacteriota bacterium]
MNASFEEAIVVFMTAANVDEARLLAETLVEKRLAACVQMLPRIESVFRWRGKVVRQGEFLLLAKTTRSHFDKLEKEVRALHSYETPEIVALAASAVSSPYLEWLQLNTAVES